MYYGRNMLCEAIKIIQLEDSQLRLWADTNVEEYRKKSYR